MALNLDLNNYFPVSDYSSLLNAPIVSDVLFAILAIIVGMVLGLIAKRIITRAGKNYSLQSKQMINSIARLIEIFIFVVFIIIALNFLGVDAAAVIIQNIINLLPGIISLGLLLFLGFIIVNVLVDILLSLLFKFGLEEYLKFSGISKGLVRNLFLVLKIFLFLIVLSASLNYVGWSIPSIDVVVTGVIYLILALIGIFIFVVFREPVSNFFDGIYIRSSILKPGQRIKVEKQSGEVLSITNHGTLLKLASGFNLLVPNKKIITESIFIKRVRAEIEKLESIRAKFISQLPSYCGPASLAMLLSFFGINVSQEHLGKLCKTKQPGGSEPGDLINTAKKVSGNSVIGALITLENIYNLRDELKGWIAEGALAVVWYKKPVLFPDKQSKSGHYVLCVGLEGDEAILMDPSPQTNGVYLIDYRLLEEAMASEYDAKSRGYIVFAKKGTAAYWRINEGLLYSEIAAYKKLSKSFERYLRRIIRKNAVVHDVISDFVFTSIKTEEGIKRIWSPGKDLQEIKEEQKILRETIEENEEEKKEGKK